MDLKERYVYLNNMDLKERYVYLNNMDIKERCVYLINMDLKEMLSFGGDSCKSLKYNNSHHFALFRLKNIFKDLKLYSRLSWSTSV